MIQKRCCRRDRVLCEGANEMVRDRAPDHCPVSSGPRRAMTPVRPTWARGHDVDDGGHRGGQTNACRLRLQRSCIRRPAGSTSKVYECLVRLQLGVFPLNSTHYLDAWPRPGLSIMTVFYAKRVRGYMLGSNNSPSYYRDPKAWRGVPQTRVSLLHTPLRPSVSSHLDISVPPVTVHLEVYVSHVASYRVEPRTLI